MKRIIFQLGSNNWQRGEEFAPGSGILHEAHHNAYNSLNNTRCYSIYPSKKQTSDRRDVRIFSLEHDIPICESISPVSSYRFHSMSESEFQGYRDRLEGFVIDYMDRVEDLEGKEIDLFIAHHSFLNPLVGRSRYAAELLALELPLESTSNLRHSCILPLLAKETCCFCTARGLSLHFKKASLG